MMSNLEETDRPEVGDLRRAIAVGIEQADRGEVFPFDEETLSEVKDRGRERLGRSRPPGPRSNWEVEAGRCDPVADAETFNDGQPGT